MAVWALSRRQALPSIFAIPVSCPFMKGQTAIQANDLLFRKTLRDNGAGVKKLFDEIEADMAVLPDNLSAPMQSSLS